MRCRKPTDLGARLAVCAFAVALSACGVGFPEAPPKEASHIADAMGVQTGMRIADVGAGDGRWAADLAARVGETGHVYATEIHEASVREIRRRVRRAGLENVTAIVGDAEAANLPEACCDAILLRMVYHHFTDPESMRRSLGLALRPEGVVVIIETEPQVDWPAVRGVPDRGGHGIAVRELIDEMAADDFELVERHDDWTERDDRYCVVFRRRF